METFLVGDYHHLAFFTYTKMARGDNLDSQMKQRSKGKINIVLHQDNITYNNQAQIHYLDRAPVLNEIDELFTSFIGLENVKTIVKEVYANKLINEKRQAVGLTTNKQVMHMIFNGNPGTGKTTVARELAKIMYQLKILSKGHFIEAQRADLVGEYIGQTAIKTSKLVEKSLGGILFIDEAYSLVRGGHKDFGREAIDTLVKLMEDYHNEFILILAGYPYEMSTFNLANPGLESRFPFHLEFKDYTIDELMAIAKQITEEREYELSHNAYLKLRKYVHSKLFTASTNFSNGRFIRNVIEKSIRLQAVRLLNSSNDSIRELTLIKSEDIQFD